MSGLSSFGLSLLFPLIVLTIMCIAARFLHDKILDSIPALDNYRSVTQGVTFLLACYLWAFPFNFGFYEVFRAIL